MLDLLRRDGQTEVGLLAVLAAGLVVLTRRNGEGREADEHKGSGRA
jgi:hypothetical protein